MKNLILVGLVALVSWQAMAAGDCPLRSGKHILASNSNLNNSSDEIWLPGSNNAVKPQPQYVKPGVRSAGTDSIKR